MSFSDDATYIVCFNVWAASERFWWREFFPAWEMFSVGWVFRMLSYLLRKSIFSLATFFIYAVYGRWEIIGGSIPLTSTKKIPIATTGEWLIFKSSLTYWRQRKESKKEFWRLTIDDITPRLTYVLVLTIRDYSRTQYAYKLFTKNVKDQQRDIRLAKAVVDNR